MQAKEGYESKKVKEKNVGKRMKKKEKYIKK
jgi:hypothetical protein